MRKSFFAINGRANKIVLILSLSKDAKCLCKDQHEEHLSAISADAIKNLLILSLSKDVQR